ncbi:MAG: serine/threonine-protein kinase, partial [Ignavibacteria bacterium]|nr:serine/threonine-protein kinase [Ignavibacteria bacterium]
MIGNTISHYKILEKLGEGGMGVVYKAHDEKLDRMVALKFLPHHLTVNEAEQTRFLQEARAAATLNHPHVCTIFDIKEEGGQQFIVMEFVEGTTLRETIERSPLGLNDGIGCAIQIGDALQEAHTKGIVHRDVKAENIMVNAKKQIKVMDFGLAKLKGSLKLTKTSSTVGTLAYMAPEQIQGGEVDARSDIFSFGVVLFEMLTGRIPFRGEHEAALMYSIVNEEPEPLQMYLPEASSELLHIMNRALEKDPEDRYQTVHDMVIDLRRLKKDSSRVSRTTLSHAIPPPASGVPEKAPAPSAPVRHDRKKMWIGIGVGVIVVLAVVLWRILQPSPKISEDLVFRPLQIPFTTIWYPGFSADGNWIAFPATDANNNTEIYYMHISGGEPKALTNDSVFKYTAEISPDGSQVIFSKGSSRSIQVFPLELWVVSTLGGGEKKLAEGTNVARWSPDGKSIAYVGTKLGGGSALWVMNADGSSKHAVITDSVGGLGSRVSMSWSPNGSSIAWIRNFVGPAGIYQEVILHAMETGKERQVTNDRKNIDEVCWTATGLILFSSNRGGASNLWAIPEKGGNPEQVTRGPGPDLGIQASR